MVAIAPQPGQVAPLRLMVPAPCFLSCSRLLAALPWPSGTSRSMRKATPAPSARASMTSSTRLAPFLQSQRVLSSGMEIRQLPQRTVRAHRYATGGLATQRGLASLSR